MDDNEELNAVKLFDGNVYIIDNSDFTRTGGQATVFKVIRFKDCKAFALKVQNNEQIWRDEDESLETNMRLEAEKACKLKHPHIVKVHGGGYIDSCILGYDGEREKLPYVLMDWVEGITLSEWFYNNSKLTVNHALDIYVQIVDAVKYLSDKGLYYQDIKKSNFMYYQGVVTLIDLTSINWNDVPEGTWLTMQSTPPEIKPGVRFVANKQSVVFALGVMFLEMFTRRKREYVSYPEIMYSKPDIAVPWYLVKLYNGLLRMVKTDPDARCRLSDVRKTIRDYLTKRVFSHQWRFGSYDTMVPAIKYGELVSLCQLGFVVICGLSGASGLATIKQAFINLVVSVVVFVAFRMYEYTKH